MGRLIKIKLNILIQSLDSDILKALLGFKKCLCSNLYIYMCVCVTVFNSNEIKTVIHKLKLTWPYLSKFQTNGNSQTACHIKSTWRDQQRTSFWKENKVTYNERSSPHCTLIMACGPFYLQGLTLIQAWIINYFHYKVRDEITYPFLNFVEVEEWISNFIPHFTGHVVIYPCQD